MYKDYQFSSILIVKTSSLGDIVHSFPVLNYLHRRFSQASIDWAVAQGLESLVASHPLVRRAIPLDLKTPGKTILSLRRIREESYDLLFDLQGNCKSGLVTFFARAKEKVGFGFRSAREWPNALATHHRFEVSRKLNIRLFNLQLLQRFFGDTEPFEIDGVAFKIDAAEKRTVEKILEAPELQQGTRIMVCPGSKWPNKQLSLDCLTDLLLRISRSFDASFLCMWGSEAERAYCEALRAALPDRCVLVDKLPIPIWQNLMSEMDLILAVDSSALHLCGTTSTPSFSVFGPTSPEVFKPIGPRHFAIQGPCPYGRTFEKQCPILRTCPTGACIRQLKGEELFKAFEQWWKLTR